MFCFWDIHPLAMCVHLSVIIYIKSIKYKGQVLGQPKSDRCQKNLAWLSTTKDSSLRSE